jgi:type IV pilus biogenesis protein PilP
MKFSILLLSWLLWIPVVQAQSQVMSGDWELCPEPVYALSNVPSSVDKLQSDIDRYTLCLDRAELLLKLEESQQKRQSGGNVDPMALPTTDLVDLKPLTLEETSEIIDGQKAVEESEAEPDLDAITVRDVKGLNGQLSANLLMKDGIETVHGGDVLSDGTEIIAITTTQVSVRKDGKIERLQWGQ